jgi:DNA polymerase-3 subunit delta'
MGWDQLQGHDATIDMLRRAAARGRLAHAYLFAGVPGIGKRVAARLLAQSLFCPSADERLIPCDVCPSCKQVKSGTHPDLLEVSRPEGKRELPIDLIVGSKERRGREGLCHDLSLRPMMATRRVAIIDDAETMNEESANALLKTLEEPPSGSILILIAADLEPILSTIRSRCQPVSFAPLPVETVASILESEGVPAAQARAAAEMGEGSTEAARRLTDPAIIQLRDAVNKGLSRQPLDPLKLTSSVMEGIENAAADTAAQRETATIAIRFFVEFYRRSLRDDRESDLEVIYAACDEAQLAVGRCLDAVGHLHQSMPVPLCMAGLCDDLGRISRGGLPAR